MKIRATVIGLGATAVLALGLGAYVFAASDQQAADGPPVMQHAGAGMMGGQVPAMADHGDMSADLGTIHELFANHDRITRSVRTLPNGIRTVTESADPRIAQLIRAHVASMGQRVESGNDPGLPMESEALHAIFANYDKVHTRVETTATGVIVTQTSSDEKTVRALKQHASEVTEFVKEGMVAMHRAMMRTGQGMMAPGMRGGMMSRVPQGDAQIAARVAQQGAGRGAPPPPPADHLEHRFENAEEWAKSFDDPARDAWQMPERVIDALNLRSGQVVADIGAGTGYFTVRLAKASAKPRVYAVDIESSMVEHVRHRAMHDGLSNVVAVLAGVDRTNLPEPVDLILMVDTFHHIPKRAAYFPELKTVMKPGARLAIIDFRKGAPSGPPEEFRFTPAQISTELAAAGFSLETTHEFLPRQLFLVYRAN
jgi:ubiquinone/menaquinone biosynthesis C-methylase UbiE